MAWDEMRGAGQVVAHDPDRVVTAGDRELDDEVHQDGLPWAVGDVEWLQEAVGFVVRHLDSGANIARADIVAHVCVHAWP